MACKGVVKGIGDYGNAFGIPIVGGELLLTIHTIQIHWLTLSLLEL